MTENHKRIVLCCCFGWFLAGSGIADRFMAVIAAVLFMLRIVLLTGEGKRRQAS